MSKKIIRLQESELLNIIKKIIIENIPASEDPEVGEPTTSAEGDPSLGESSNSYDNIVCIQNSLKKDEFGKMLGTSGPNKDGVDGKLGNLTIAAIKTYQEKYDISKPGTGFVGPKTASKMGCKRLPKRKELIKKTPEQSKKEIVDKIKKVYDNEIPPVKVTKEEDTRLFFDGTNLNWISNGQTIKKWPAKSGRPVTKGELTPDQKKLVAGYDRSPEDVSKSNTEYSKVKNAGNIPQGNYKLGVLQTRSGSKASELLKNIKDIWEIYRLRKENEDEGHEWNTGTILDKIAWGDYRAPIIKGKGTETYGRGSFYVHGGAIPGSIGCIDLATNMDDFAKYYSTWQARTNKSSMSIEVNYI